MVGSDAPLPIDTGAIGSVFETPALTDDLARIGVYRPEDILGRYCCGRDTLLAMAGDVERNTDDNMRIEYSAPLHLHESTEEANSRLLAKVAELPLAEVQGTDSLVALANAYAEWDLTWRRTLATLRFAHSKDPGSMEVERLYAEYLAEAREMEREEQP
jgi:hypothetical protein